MDLMRILRSLEEFLYELVGWLVFYPRTLWRILRNPAAVAKYTQLQLAQEPEAQFTETVSPVLMLILSVVIAHAAEMAMGLPSLELSSSLRQALFGTEQGLLATRSVVFCTFALVAAVVTLHRQRLPINRDTLREPFSIQSYLVAPFAILFSLGMLMLRAEDSRVQFGGLLLCGGACAWYIWARVAAYRYLTHSRLLPSLALVLSGFLVTGTLVVVLVLLV